MIVLCALLLAGGPALAGRSDEAPVMLTNEDVARLHSKSPGARPSQEPSAKRERAAAPPARKPATPSQDAAKQSLGSAPSSWQEEYYRLKALALKGALERGDPIDFRDGGAARLSAPGPASPADDTPAVPSKPACMYASDGSLIYGPPGRGCSADRKSRSVTRPASSSVACIFGTEGELLHQPAGRTCAGR